MADRQVFVRLGVAVVVAGGLVGGFVLLTGKDKAPPAAVRVVDEPSAAAPAPRPVARQQPSQVPAPQSKPDPGGLAIVYELSGTGTATVVYDENGLGLVHQELNVALPWRKELTWKNAGGSPTVQVLGQGSGHLECRISVRGTVVLTNAADNGDVATCAGKLS